MAAELNLSGPGSRLEEAARSQGERPAERHTAIGQQILVVTEFQLKPNRGRGYRSWVRCHLRFIRGKSSGKILVKNKV